MKRKILKLIGRILKGSRSVVVSFQEKERKEAADAVNKILATGRMLLSLNEGVQLYMLAKRTNTIEGDIAEVGTYLGGSAKLMSLVKGSRTIHTFDSFEGLPAPKMQDGRRSLYEGQFTAGYEDVRAFLGSAAQVYKGWFPQAAGALTQGTFSLVHLDTDLYQSTKDGLEYFYPRLSRGGAIISHDYTYEGVRQAFDEFFAGKKEIVIPTAGSQCIVIKL